jgi:hypothetical protein
MAASKIFAYSSTGTKFAAGFMLCVTSIRVVFSISAAAGNECQIQDSQGNVIYDVFATGADYVDSQRYEKMPMVNGLVVQTLANCTVYVEID